MIRATLVLHRGAQGASTPNVCERVCLGDERWGWGNGRSWGGVLSGVGGGYVAGCWRRGILKALGFLGGRSVLVGHPGEGGGMILIDRRSDQEGVCDASSYEKSHSSSATGEHMWGPVRHPLQCHDV